MKKILLILGIIFLVSIELVAAPDNAGATTLNTYQIATSSWYPIFKQASLYLFASLATIELVLVFGFMALRGELEITGILAQLIRLTLIFGLFLIFFQNPNWMNAIFDGFNQLGNNAGAVASIDTLTDSAYTVLTSVSDNTSIWEPIDSVFLSIIGVLTVLAIIGLGVELLMAYVKFLIVLNLSVLFFAFGAFSFTRQWAYNSVINIIKVGVEYMLIKLVIGLSILNIQTLANEAMENDGKMFELLILTLMIFGLTRMIHGIAESYFSGHGASNSNHGLQMAKSATIAGGAGAVGGAMASVNQVAQAAAAGNQMSSIGSGSGNNASANNSTGKVGNFLKSAGAGAMGAVAGATSGAIKGSLGMNTLGVGQKSGTSVGKAFSGKSANQNLSMNSPSIASKKHNLHADDKLDGTISKAKDDVHNNSTYVSGVPRDKPNE